MEPSERQAWLDVGSTRVRVGSGGVLLGRDARCDLVLSDPTASRFHAVVVHARSGPTVSATGRADVVVNGRATRFSALADGDRIVVPGLELVLHLVDAPAEAPLAWSVRIPGGPTQVRIGAAGLSLGAGGDLAPAGWPADALRLRPEADRLVAVGRQAWTCNGHGVQPGIETSLGAGDALRCAGGVEVVVARAMGSDAPTARPAGGAPEEVELTFLANGGRLRVVLPSGDEAVAWIPERRFALLVCLLAPAAPLRPGDSVPDEVVLAGVWPRQPSKTRVDLNVLLKRLRSDLADAGLPTDLVVRVEGGGASRFRLADGAMVRVT